MQRARSPINASLRGKLCRMLSLLLRSEHAVLLGVAGGSEGDCLQGHKWLFPYVVSFKSLNDPEAKLPVLQSFLHQQGKC